MAELKAKIGLETNAFETGLGRLQNKVGSFAKGIGGLVVGAFAFDKLLSAMSNAINKGDQLQDLANKFGISASQLQLLGNAAELSGASLESVAAALNKAAVNAQRASGDKNLAAGFEKIGMSLQDLQKASPQDILMKFADAAASGAISGEEFSLAVQLMGRSATDLLPTLRQGSDAIRTQGEAMGVWSDTTIAALGGASDAIKVIGNVWTLAFGNIVAAILPATAALARFLGLTNLANVIETKPSERSPMDETQASRTNPKDTREKINENLRKQLDLENKIAEKGMTQEQIAQRLLATYSALASQKKLVESFKTEEGDLQASALGVEMAQIKDRLSGMGGTAGSMQVLADSLQQVGGGGRFAQVGGNETKDYLRAIKDSSAVSAKALQEMAGTNRGSVTPLGVE
jgi:transcriptional regulator with XRE-family HTH domain